MWAARFLRCPLSHERSAPDAWLTEPTVWTEPAVVCRTCHVSVAFATWTIAWESLSHTSLCGRHRLEPSLKSYANKLVELTVRLCRADGVQQLLLLLRQLLVLWRAVGRDPLAVRVTLQLRRRRHLGSKGRLHLRRAAAHPALTCKWRTLKHQLHNAAMTGRKSVYSTPRLVSSASWTYYSKAEEATMVTHWAALVLLPAGQWTRRSVRSTRRRRRHAPGSAVHCAGQVSVNVAGVHTILARCAWDNMAAYNAQHMPWRTYAQIMTITADHRVCVYPMRRCSYTA